MKRSIAYAKMDLSVHIVKTMVNVHIIKKCLFILFNLTIVPCYTNPCLNNGTCHTSAGMSSFYCECEPSFGGKICDIGMNRIDSN